MANKRMWLPVGSVVTLKNAEKPVMVAGFMARDAATGDTWDYLGYPYPEGRRNGQDLFFNRDQIAAVGQVGFLNAEGCAHQAFIATSAEAIANGIVHP